MSYKSFLIGDIGVGEGYDPLVIPEIGINHNGDLSVAKKMVYSAYKAGAKLIKHQTHVVDDEMCHVAKNIIPGNADLEGFNIKGSRRLYGSNMNIEIPDKNIKRPRLIIDPIDGDLKGSRRLDFNMNNNMNPGNINADINTLKLKTNLDMKGNIKGPKINDPKLNMDIKI